MSEYIVRMPPSMPYEIRAELNAWYVESEPIVRCKDCKYYQPKEGAMLSCRFEYHGFTQWKLAEPDGFCAWGEPRGDWITCKCGEELEAASGWVVCPSCGRRWMNER